MRKRSSYRPKAALLQCKTAAFASYLSYIYAEIVCKIERKTLVLPHKQAVFVAQYYPISVQQLAFQRLKVARKKEREFAKTFAVVQKSARNFGVEALKINNSGTDLRFVCK